MSLKVLNPNPYMQIINHLVTISYHDERVSDSSSKTSMGSIPENSFLIFLINYKASPLINSLTALFNSS